jgi:hypothetical protein
MNRYRLKNVMLQPVQTKTIPFIKDQFLNKGLAFEAPAWHRANLNTVILQRVFRQVKLILHRNQSDLHAHWFGRSSYFIF